MLLLQHETLVTQQAEFMEFDRKLIDREPGCKQNQACFVKRFTDFVFVYTLYFVI